MKTLHILAVLGVSAVWLVGADARAQESGDTPDPASQEMIRLQGTWKAVGSQFAGRGRSKGKNKNPTRGLTYVVSGHEATIRRFDKVEGRYTLSVDPTRMPHHIDQTNSDGKTYHGIYRLTDTTLTICLPTDPNAPRPRQFATKAGDGHVLRTYRKVKGKPSAGPPGTPTPRTPGR